MGGDDETKAASFQAVGDGQRPDRKTLRRNGGIGRGANGTEMVRGWRAGEVGAEMELRAQEDERQQQGEDAKPVNVLVHVVK